MKTNLYNQEGAIIETIDLPETVFNVALNADLVHQVYLAQFANLRQPIAHTKDRSAVSGGGKKPWKQKGTGRARHASIRSPIWKGGGVAFGPTKDRNFAQKVNKKMKRKALFMVLTSKVKDKELAVLKDMSIPETKTKQALKVVDAVSTVLENYKKGKKKRDSILLVTAKNSKDITRITNNLPFVKVLSADSLNVADLLASKYLVMLQDALPVIETTYKI